MINLPWSRWQIKRRRTSPHCGRPLSKGRWVWGLQDIYTAETWIWNVVRRIQVLPLVSYALCHLLLLALAFAFYLSEVMHPIAPLNHLNFLCSIYAPRLHGHLEGTDAVHSLIWNDTGVRKAEKQRNNKYEIIKYPLQLSFCTLCSILSSFFFFFCGFLFFLELLFLDELRKVNNYFYNWLRWTPRQLI